MSGGVMTGANPESEKIASYPLFDWLRFVLASVVVLAHARRQQWYSRALAIRLATIAYATMAIGIIGGLLIAWR